MDDQGDMFGGPAERVLKIASAARLETSIKSILMAIMRRDQDGVTADTMLREFHDMPYSTVTGAWSKLEKRELIYYRGDTVTGASRRKQRVMRFQRRRNETIGFIDCRRSPSEKAT